jgi:predicted metal-dependent TIM-barrel fold hydrolase
VRIYHENAKRIIAIPTIFKEKRGRAETETSKVAMNLAHKKDFYMIIRTKGLNKEEKTTKR